VTAGPDDRDIPPPDPGDVDRLRVARARVLERIAAACERSGRDPASVSLVAVSKTVSDVRLRAAVAAGLTTLAENRVQEAAAKVPLVPGARWHLVGPLQSNKAGRAIRLFDVVETVDSVELAVRLDRLVRTERGAPETGPLAADERLPVLLQVNVDRDPGKAGFDPDALGAALPRVLGLGALEPAGLMTIGRLVADPELARPTFRALRSLARRLRERHPGLGAALSMGMSDDFPVAVEEGATLVRVGRAIFGERPPI
jgi:pyridoxal phosphate enzyme (YggS family)